MVFETQAAVRTFYRYSESIKLVVLPLLEQKNSLGIVGIYFKDDVVSLNFEQKKLTESVSEYIAQAVLRTQLVNELEQAKSPVKQSAYVLLYYLRYRMIYARHSLLLLSSRHTCQF